MPVKHCAAGNCTSDSRKLKNLKKYPWMKNISFFQFPTNGERQIWISRTRRVNPDDNRKPWTPPLHTYLCSKHFIDSAPTPENPHPTLFHYNGYSCKATATKATGPASSSLPGDKRKSLDELYGTRKPVPPSSVPTYVNIGPSRSDDGPLELTTESTEVVHDDHLPVGANETVSSKAVDKQFDCGKELIIQDAPSRDHDYDVFWDLPCRGVTVATQTECTGVQFDEMAASHERFKNKEKLRRELFVEAVLENDTSIRQYTGIGSRTMLDGLFSLIEKSTANFRNLIYWKGGKNTKAEPSTRKKSRKRSMTYFEEFIMTLVRFRLGLLGWFTADLFGVSSTVSSNVFATWINVMYAVYSPFIKWASKRTTKKNLPRSFRSCYPNTRAIIDCSEFFVQKPSNPGAQSCTYSTYKSHNTAKALLSVSPWGSFNFISKLYGGNASDRFITKDSGFIEMVEAGDSIMADRGFSIQDLLLPKKAVLNMPPFTHKAKQGKGKRLNTLEIKKTRKIAKLRIHVERAIGRLKWFRLIGNIIPLTLKPLMNQMLSVGAFLCNISPPLVKK